MAKGLFITLEGGEGSGKSTLLNQLAQEFTQRGRTVVTTREPGGSQLGEAIRKWLLSTERSFKIGHQAELLLFLAARAQHIEEVIRPALQAGKIVLCDRFNDSTVAYQGAARGLPMEETEQLCQLVCGPIQPNITLFLDVDPLQGLLRSQRISKEHAQVGHLDRIESETLEFHEKVRQAFIDIAKKNPSRVHRLDANQPQIDVFKEAMRLTVSLLLTDKQACR